MAVFPLPRNTIQVSLSSKVRNSRSRASVSFFAMRPKVRSVPGTTVQRPRLQPAIVASSNAVAVRCCRQGTLSSQGWHRGGRTPAPPAEAGLIAHNHLKKIGTPGRTRTNTSLRTTDFESAASTIPPLGHRVVGRQTIDEVFSRSRVSCRRPDCCGECHAAADCAIALGRPGRYICLGTASAPRTLWVWRGTP